MPYINRCQFMGHAGADWVLTKTSVSSVLRGSLAISKGKGNDGQERGTVWVQCKVWGRYAEVVEGWGGVKRGDLVLVTGRWDQTKGKDGKVYDSLNVDELTNFSSLFSRSAQNGSGQDAQQPVEEEEADIPF